MTTTWAMKSAGDRPWLPCFVNYPEPLAEPVTANPSLRAAFDQTLMQIDKRRPGKSTQMTDHGSMAFGQARLRYDVEES
jgi:hypothetical protein